MKGSLFFSIAAAALLLIGCGDKPKEQSQTVSSPQAVVEQKTTVKEPALQKEQLKTEVETVKVTAINEKALYAKCAGCHGQKGEKKALGVSVAIADWDSKQIEDSLTGYQKGTYGGNMKSIMISQVKSLSSEEIKVLSDYIAKF